MANCVNTSSKEFKELAKNFSVLNKKSVAARVSIFQDMNGTDRFPTVEEIIDRKINSKIEDLHKIYMEEDGFSSLSSLEDFIDFARLYPDEIDPPTFDSFIRGKNLEPKVENVIEALNRQYKLFKESVPKKLYDTARVYLKAAITDEFSFYVRKNVTGSYDSKGNLTSLSVNLVPTSTKVNRVKSLYGQANRIAKEINKKFLGENKTFGEVAKVVNEGTPRIVLSPSIEMTKFISVFDMKLNSVDKDFIDRQYKRRALEKMFLLNQISEDMYYEIEKREGLENIKLSLASMRLLASGNPITFSRMSYKGKRYDKAEDAYKDFDQDTQEDEMPDIPIPNNSQAVNPVNIDKYKKKREAQIKIIEKKISQLYNRRSSTGNSGRYTPKIKYLQGIVDRIKQDLDSTTFITDPIVNIRESFKEDIKDIRKIFANVDLDNIFLARDMLSILKKNMSVSKTNYDGYIFEESATHKDIEEVMQEFSPIVDELTSKYNTIVSDLFLGLMSKYEKKLDTIYPGQDIEQVKKDLLKTVKDTDFVSRYIGSFGRDFTTDDVIGRLIRLEYELEQHKQIRKIAGLRQSLDNVLETIQDKLKGLGYVFNGNTNWMDAFTRQTENDLELVSKYTSNWKNFIKATVFNTKAKLFAASTNKDFKEINNILNSKYNQLRINTDFVDFTLLPEIVQVYKNDAEYQGQFNKSNLKYAQELKAKLGEEEYQSLINRQINFLEEFKYEKNKITESYLAKRGYQDLSELNDVEIKTLNQLLNRYDPVYFIKNVSTQGNKVMYSKDSSAYLYHFMDFNTFIPKEYNGEGNPTGFFDDKFKEIEKDQELYNAWKIFEEAVFIVNDNLGGTTTLNKRSIIFLKREIQNQHMNQNWFKRARNTIASGVSASIEFIKNQISDYDNSDKTYEENEVQGVPGVKSFKAKVDNLWRVDLEALSNFSRDQLKLDLKDTLNLSSMDPMKRDAIFNILEIKDLQELKSFGINPDAVVVSQLKQFTRRKIYDEQTLNLPVLMKMLLEQSAIQKAREEAFKIEKEVLSPVADNYEYYGSSEQGNKASNLQDKRDMFVKTVLRNDRDTKQWGNLTKLFFSKIAKNGKFDTKDSVKMITSFMGRDFFTKNLSPEEKKSYEIGTERLVILRQLQGKFTDKRRIEKLEKEIIDIENRLGRLGQDYILSSLFDAVFIKAFVKIKLGLNPKAALQNLAQSSQQNYIQSGHLNDKGEVVGGDYTSQQFNTAASFSRRMSRNKAEEVFGMKQPEQSNIAGSFISTLNVIQDGTDIFQKAERTGVSQGPELDLRKKSAWNIMKFTEVTEYYNQVPTILAVAMNYKMPDGNPIFDGTKFPYHEVRDGVFRLKPEYLNAFQGVTAQEMIDNYETFTSEDATFWTVNLKYDIIPKRNGDYTDSGAILAKTETLGRATMTFSNWVFAILHSAYHSQETNFMTGKKETGYVTEMFDNSDSMILGSAIGANALLNSVIMSSAITISYTAIPAILGPLTLILGAGALMVKGSKRGITNTNLTGESTAQFIEKSFRVLLHTATVGSFIPLISFLNGIYNRVANGDLDIAEKIGLDYTFGGTVGEKTASALRKNAQQQQLLNFISMVTGLVVLVASSLGGEEDEDEPKTLKKAGGVDNPYREYQNQKRQKNAFLNELKYIAVNMMQQMHADTFLTLDPQSMLYTIVGEADSSKSLSLGSEVGKIGYQGVKGVFEEEYEGIVKKPGDLYEGDKKYAVELRKFLLPPMIRNVDKAGEGNWMLGFEGLAQKYYVRNKFVEEFGVTDYKSDLKKDRSKRNSIRTDLETNMEILNYVNEDTKKAFIKTILGGEEKSYDSYTMKQKDAIDGIINDLINKIAPLSAREGYDKDQKTSTKFKELLDITNEISKKRVEGVLKKGGDPKESQQEIEELNTILNQKIKDFDLEKKEE